MKYEINYLGLSVLSTFFTRSTTPFGFIVRAVTNAKVEHQGLITSDHGQLFATEERFTGLQERSLEEYTTDSNKIVALYYWHGWDVPARRNAAECYLAEIRRKQKENSKYNFAELFCFVWPFSLFLKRQGDSQLCSENSLSVHDRFGFNSGFDYSNRGPSPLESELIFQGRKDVSNLSGIVYR